MRDGKARPYPPGEGKGRHPDYEAATPLSGPCKAYIGLPGRLDSRDMDTEPNGLGRLVLPHARSRSACQAQRARAGPAHVDMLTPVEMSTSDPRHPRSATPRPPRQRASSLLVYWRFRPAWGLAQALHSPRAARRVHGCAALPDARAGRSIGL